MEAQQGLGGASSSSTIQEAEAEESEGDTKEDIEEDCLLRRHFLWGEYQTPSPGTHLSKLFACLLIVDP